MASTGAPVVASQARVSSPKVPDMCRSIVRLREGSQIHDRDGMEAAALQYVRKVSGFRQPSQANQATFDEAVTAVANATETLMESLQLRI